ncbi:MAG: hypothetical protein AAB225_00410 [Acidobacteriota bacterium]
MAKIAPGLGAAEQESLEEATFFRNFLPLPDHARALDPDILLILGGRGAGKTELFRVLAYPNGLGALAAEQKQALPFDPARTIWVPGFGRTHKDPRAFPPPEVLSDHLSGADSQHLRAFWLGLLVGRLLNVLGQDAVGGDWAQALSPDLQRSLAETSMLAKWLGQSRARLDEVNDALDRIDVRLARGNQWLFITYDELDRLLPNYNQLSAPIRELLALWLDRWRRWERIRPKIFLRNDLFREEFLAFPDASKLRGHRVEITWQAPSLYRLLAKRIANAGEMAQTYFDRYVQRMPLQRTDILGLLPENSEAGFTSLMETMVGRYMGANIQKGRTYYWIPNHLQDAAGQIAPRSFLKLFALAAESARDKADTLSLPTVLRPTDLQGALMETSTDRIRELQEEYPWMEALKEALTGLEVPALRHEFQRRLTRANWGREASRALPDQSASGVFNHLKDIGVVALRRDGKVNVPEIYLYGFGLKRRGGISRPR